MHIMILTHTHTMLLTRTHTHTQATWRGGDVAVKLMHGMTEGSPMLETFRKECFMLSRLKHPNIVNFLGASLAPPNVCIVQELAEGGSLYSLLHGSGAENNPMKYVRVLQYGLDIADAMAYLHPSIVHRYVTPTPFPLPA